MPQSLQDALKQTRLYSDGEKYRLVKLPASAIMAAAGVLAEVAHAFSALIVDRDEVTLLLMADAYEEYERRLKDGKASETIYRMITPEAHLEPELTGYISVLSAALAAQGVPILPYGAYSKDHIFVPDSSFDTAWQTLENLLIQYS